MQEKQIKNPEARNLGELKFKVRSAQYGLPIDQMSDRELKMLERHARHFENDGGYIKIAFKEKARRNARVPKDVANKHQLRVLKQLVKMNEAAIPFAGGGYNSLIEVVGVLRDKFGYTIAEIEKIRGGAVRNISPELQDAIDSEKERAQKDAEKIEAISTAAQNPHVVTKRGGYKATVTPLKKPDAFGSYIVTWRYNDERKDRQQVFHNRENAIAWAQRQFGVNKVRILNANTKRNASGDLYNAHRLDELSGMFQGEISGEQIETVGSNFTPAVTSRLGQLSLLKVNNGGDIYEITFSGDAWLSMDARKNLHISGKNARIRNAKKPRDGNLTLLGTLEQFNYITAKRHIENGELVEYFHEVGEVDGIKPNVFIDRDGFPLIFGGNYDVGIHGVEN